MYKVYFTNVDFKKMSFEEINVVAEKKSFKSLKNARKFSADKNFKLVYVVNKVGNVLNYSVN